MFYEKQKIFWWPGYESQLRQAGGIVGKKKAGGSMPEEPPAGYGF
jgi:hypothetical protein